MPRQVRVEYEDAIYHVMARGNRLDKIVLTDADREAFEATLEEVVAEILPKNGYHYGLMHDFSA